MDFLSALVSTLLLSTGDVNFGKLSELQRYASDFDTRALMSLSRSVWNMLLFGDDFTIEFEDVQEVFRLQHNEHSVMQISDNGGGSTSVMFVNDQLSAVPFYVDVLTEFLKSPEVVLSPVTGPECVAASRGIFISTPSTSMLWKWWRSAISSASSTASPAKRETTMSDCADVICLLSVSVDRIRKMIKGMRRVDPDFSPGVSSPSRSPAKSLKGGDSQVSSRMIDPVSGVAISFSQLASLINISAAKDGSKAKEEDRAKAESKESKERKEDTGSSSSANERGNTESIVFVTYSLRGVAGMTSVDQLQYREYLYECFEARVSDYDPTLYDSAVREDIERWVSSSSVATEEDLYTPADRTPNFVRTNEKLFGPIVPLELDQLEERRSDGFQPPDVGPAEATPEGLCSEGLCSEKQNDEEDRDSECEYFYRPPSCTSLGDKCFDGTVFV